MPLDLQEEVVASKRGIPYHIWKGYDVEERGKIMAAKIVQDRLQLVERFYNEIERNKG